MKLVGRAEAKEVEVIVRAQEETVGTRRKQEIKTEH